MQRKRRRERDEGMTASTLAAVRETTPTFDDWLAARGSALLSFAWMVTRNREDAKDVLQDALVGLCPRWERFGDVDEAEAYLKRSIVNGSVSNWRKNGRRLVPVADPGQMQPAVPDFTETNDEADLAWQLCETLTPQQRAVVVLRFREDCSFADIARILEIPQATARSHAHRALARLRKELEKAREEGR
ncbi:sigma-70 family RNA polymerase sigma factor [Luteococcus sp. Sow4_B9]|uniref:sigma-70 family RNA polymerase sigma factor n=1 Tax=Luteococcus sp. Sow4_B9 TaxID=3438792 RepID=UPI003F98A5DA